jgi:hypothetical protein
MAGAPIRGLNAAHDKSLFSAERSLARLTFRRADLPAVRRFTAAFAARAGIARSSRLTDLVLAVNEGAACAVSHGPCTAMLRLWTTGTRVFCEIRGDGMLLGYGPRAAVQGDAEALRRRVLQQICDHAQVDAGPHGVTVRFSITVA